MIALLLHAGVKPAMALPMGIIGDLIIARILINALAV